MNDCPVRVGEHDGVSLSELRGPDRLSARYRIDYQARTFRSIRANIQLNLILGCVAVAIALALNAPVPVVGVWALALLLLSVAILAQVPVSVSHTSTAWIAHAMPPGLNGLIWGGFAYCVPTHHLSVGVGVCLAIGFVAVARLAVYQRVAMAHLVGSAVALLGPTSSNPDAPLWVITGVAIAGAAYGVLRLQDASRQQFRDHVEQAELSGVIEVLHNQLAPPAVSHEAFANAIAESLTDALITVDSDRTIVSANHNAGRLASQTRQRLNGQTLNDVFELRAHGRATTLEWQDILDCGVPQQALLGAPSSGTRYPTIIRGVAHPGGHTLIIQDLTETLSAQRLAAHNLSRDPVSSGFNRTAFQSELSDVLARVSDQTPAALVFVELEQYDQVLEACGYPAADELIRQLSDTLRQRLRHSDTFAR
ncbi:MAG: diguanylate cyclase, partial [Gammaproteobacteria bacterium]|nr:diguanylate cyclase [Gammaproteobacteria bacterium]